MKEDYNSATSMRNICEIQLSNVFMSSTTTTTNDVSVVVVIIYFILIIIVFNYYSVDTDKC
jgi:hypothetical protein